MKSCFSVKLVQFFFGGGAEMVHVVIDRYFSLFLKGLKIFLHQRLSLINKMPINIPNLVIYKGSLIYQQVDFGTMLVARPHMDFYTGIERSTCPLYICLLVAVQQFLYMHIQKWYAYKHAKSRVYKQSCHVYTWNKQSIGQDETKYRTY